MLSTLNNFIAVNPDDILEQAREEGLNVKKIKDFRKQGYHYKLIEEMMDDYLSSFARFSAASGLTAGIGGFTTSLAFAGLDTFTTAVRLYRLSQRFAVLNGFDGRKPFQKSKILNIYLETLGVDAVTKAALKQQLFGGGRNIGSEGASILFKLIVKAGGFLGKHISQKDAARTIPVVGGLVGAGVNYTLARKAGKKMKKAYKHAYYDTWQG